MTLDDLPELKTLAETLRERLGAKLNYLETPQRTVGRRPWWWQPEWETPREPRRATRRAYRGRQVRRGGG